MAHLVRAAFDYYLKYAPVKPATQANIRFTRAKVAKGKLLMVEIADLKAPAVRDFYANLEGKESTKFLAYAALLAVLRFYTKEQKLDIDLRSITGLFKQPRQIAGEHEDEEYLTLAQVKQLRALEIKKNMTVSRDMFVIMCFTGMSISDLLNFRPSDNIHGDWIHYRRVKNGNPCKVPLLPVARKLIEQQKWPVTCTKRVIQIHCNKIGALFGVPLHPHMARHTFGCISLELGFSMDSVRAMMGHSSIKTTERIYAKVTQDKLQRELDQMTAANKTEIETL